MPRVLHAHSPILAFSTLRNESTGTVAERNGPLGVCGVGGEIAIGGLEARPTGRGRLESSRPRYFNSSSSALASARSGSSCSARFTKMMARALSWDLWAMRAWRK